MKQKLNVAIIFKTNVLQKNMFFGTIINIKTNEKDW